MPLPPHNPTSRPRSRSLGAQPEAASPEARSRAEAHDAARRRPRSASLPGTASGPGPDVPGTPSAPPQAQGPVQAPPLAPPNQPVQAQGPVLAPPAPPAQQQARRPIRQVFPNSCGANALLNACLELGTTWLPQRNEYPLWSHGHTELRPDQTCETMIYSVTSGRGGALPGPDTGYSMPSYIAECAAALGRRASVYLPGSLLTFGLVLTHPMDIVRAMSNGVPIAYREAPRPGPNQRLMRVMQVTGGLHYVLERDDGTVWDPGLGQSFPDMPALIAAQQVEGGNYSDTGIAVLIQ